MNIILCGYKSSGKTTLAKAYSDNFGYEYIDTDKLMLDELSRDSEQYGTIGDVYRKLGEVSFRMLEFKVIQKIQNIKNTIIATGGGTVLNTDNVALLKSYGVIVYLNVNKVILANRLVKLQNLPGFIDSTNKDDNIKSYLNSRDHIYQLVSDYSINIHDESIQELISLLHQYRCQHGQ